VIGCALPGITFCHLPKKASLKLGRIGDRKNLIRGFFDAARYRPGLPAARTFKPEHVLQPGYGQTAMFGAKFGQSSLIGSP
jgi:hypothetical protein